MSDQELPQNGCPTPKKHRFATVEAALSEAERASFALKKRLYPYDNCECGWIHLTSKKSRASVREARTLDQLIKMDSEEFAELVRKEIKGHIHPDEAKHLRSPALLFRWFSALKVFQIEIAAQLAAKSGQRDPETVAWRGRVGVIQAKLCERRREVRLLNVSHRGERSPIMRPDMKDLSDKEQQAELRRGAGEAALHRLKKEHFEEFTRYLLEELQASGAEIPERIIRHAERHGVPTARKSEEEGGCG